MNTLLVATRAVHFACALLLFGELVFLLAVAKPVWRDAGLAATSEDKGVYHRPLVVALWSVIAGITSGVVWLALEAVLMSGMPFAPATHPDTLGLILSKTTFGCVWVLRFGLVLALCALLLVMRLAPNAKRNSRLAIGAAALAATYLATLAWVGHAGAGQGLDRFIQIISDGVHLLAAGAWLGALPGLVFLLASGWPLDVAARAARRFSILGVVSVSALILTGLANAWYLVGDVPALVGTSYGWLLLTKLALFAAMVTLAIVNRRYLTPRLAAHDRRALRSLRRNAMLEIAAGLMVVTIVGALGITAPATHQSPRWPFDHTPFEVHTH